eukprot:332887-Pelagomonas_calceolata.AAC.5
MTWMLTSARIHSTFISASPFPVPAYKGSLAEGKSFKPLSGLPLMLAGQNFCDQPFCFCLTLLRSWSKAWCLGPRHPLPCLHASLVPLVTLGGDLQPGRLVNRLVDGLSQPGINPQASTQKAFSSFSACRTSLSLNFVVGWSYGLCTNVAPFP